MIDPETDKLDDERLDVLLRQVAIPEDLHQRLLGLPDLEDGIKVIDEKGSKPEVNWQFRSVLAIAACYLIVSISILFFWPTSNGVMADRSQVDEIEDGRTDSIRGSDSLHSGKKKSVVDNEQNSIQEELRKDLMVVARADRAVRSIEEKLNEMEIRRLESRLALLEKDLNEIDSDEKSSIVLAIADQTAFNFGSSREKVIEDLSSVVDRYPNSRGAKIVSQFVNVVNQ